MSWRRFCVLLSGLSTDSLWVLTNVHGRGRVVTDRKHAERMFDRWGK